MKIAEILWYPLHEAKLSPQARQHARALIEFLNTQGVDKVDIDYGSKHPRLVFTYLGRQMYYTIPGSPSDNWRGTKNALSDLRRLISLVNPDPTVRLPLRQRVKTFG